jgi:hypothetical protein
VTCVLDAGKIRDLASEFGFAPDVLASKLHWIAFGAFRVADGKAAERGQKDLKRLLKKIQNQAEALRASLQEVGTTSAFHGELFHEFKHLHMMEAELSELAQVAETFQPKRKENSDTVRSDIIITLSAKLWKTLTGKQATLTWTESSGEFGGEYLKFLKGVAEIMGVDSDPLPQRFKRLKARDPNL